MNTDKHGFKKDFFTGIKEMSRDLIIFINPITSYHPVKISVFICGQKIK